jgi:hypothetical protein
MPFTPECQAWRSLWHLTTTMNGELPAVQCLHLLVTPHATR